MEIRTESWQELHNKLGTSDASPPTPVYVTVYALTRGAGIEVSYARRELRDASTIWRNWVLTDNGHLVHCELEFAAENYDSYAEDSLRNMGNQDSTIDPVVHKAWVRRLEDVTSLHIAAVGRLTGFQKNWFPVGDIRLTFADGTDTNLPGQTQVSPNDREWFDRFLNALRGRVKL